MSKWGFMIQKMMMTIGDNREKTSMPKQQALSAREQEVVNLLLTGKSNKLIASALGISDRTVEFHLKNIFAKRQVASRTELILKLGTSTVAGREEITENRASRSWATLLREAVSMIGKELRMESFMKASEEANPETFFGAIRVCLAKYAEFNGRATRPEFWWFALFITLGASALAYISEALGSVFLIATLLPLLAAGARRLHDTGRSGWWQLFLLVPIAGIVIVGSLWALPPADGSSE